LDYHGTIEAYHAVKRQFMTQFSGQSIYPEDYHPQAIPFDSPLKGAFNTDNMKAALAILRAIGVSDSALATVGPALRPPPGRFEPVECGQPFDVIVDYAHAPDGLERVLTAIAALGYGRVITVFGCGGDRDVTKRPLMGKIADQSADYIVLTDDNPRTESPEQITQAIAQGIASTPFTVLHDRKAAMAHAFDIATAGDCVLIAGKGHETYQITASGTHEFDDAAIAKELLRA